MRFPQIHKKDMEILCVMLIIRAFMDTAVADMVLRQTRLQRIPRVARVLFAATGTVDINVCAVMPAVTF